MGNEKERNSVETMLDPENGLSRKRSQKEFEELLLKDVLIELESGDADYWEQKAMELADEPGYTPTAQQRAAFEERLDLEMKRIQKQKEISQTTQTMQTAETVQTTQGAQDALAAEPIQGSQTMSKNRPKNRSFLRKVGSIAAVLVLFVFMTMYHTVDAFAAGVDRFIATMVPDEGAEELRIEEKNGGGVELNMADYVGMYFPDWIPRGYVIDTVRSSISYKKLIYTNKSNDIVYFEIDRGGYSVMVDDEEVIEESIYLHDSQGRLVMAEDSVCIVWEDGEYLYTISGRLNLQDELIKMARECVKVEG